VLEHDSALRVLKMLVQAHARSALAKNARQRRLTPQSVPAEGPCRSALGGRKHAWAHQEPAQSVDQKY
jgi:hypothetical protein